MLPLIYFIKVMESGSSFQRKMSKVENLLSIVNNEVDSVITLLNYFKQYSYEMVEALKKISSSSAFLKEYLEMNSFLLKYLDFLTEISCKFEILQAPNKGENILQNSTSIISEDIKLYKPESVVNSKDNAIPSTVLPKNSMLDCLSDTSNSVENFYVKKVSVRSKSKKPQRKRNKNFSEVKKEQENKLTNELQSEDSYSDDKQITCEEIQMESSKSEVNETDEEIKVDKSLKYSITENEMESFGQNSYKNGNLCALLKEPINNNTFCKVQSEILSQTVEIPVPKNLYKNLGDAEKNSEFETTKDSYSILTKMNSLDSVSAVQLKGCNDKLYDIKPINISRKVGKEYKVIVEHIISPSEFYVYILEKQIYSFTELEEKLKLIQKDPNFHSKKESKTYLSQIIGKYALYYSKCDEKWCRAKVTDWRVNHKDDLIYIFLLDYGESKCVMLDDIQPMPDCVKLYPAFIQRCHLYGIYPTEVNLSSKTLAWSKAASEKMKCLVDRSEDLKIKIAPEDTYHPAKSLPVTLWLVDEGDNCVNELLVQSQYAQYAKKPEILTENISESEYLERWNPMKEDFESYLNSYDLDIEDPAAVIYGYIGKDYERICRHFAKTGKCFKGESCKKEHVCLNPSGFTTDKEVVYNNAVNALPLPPPKSFVSVQVTCILSLNLFCCIRDESAWTSEEETLQSLVQYMNSKENIRDMKKLLIPPSVGQIVIAKYSVDNSWYRAKILESQPESDQYTVLFVDYGNKEGIPLSSIRAIEGRYLHLPFQAMQCFIFGITQNPRVSAKEGMDYLNKRMTEGHINLEVIATYPGDHPRLLVHVYDQNGKNIGTDLVAENYAKFKEELLVNSESTSVPG